MNFYIPVGRVGFNRMLNYLGHATVDSIGKADAVLFSGGADVSPGLYGEDPHPYTAFNKQRDMDDIQTWQDADSLGLFRIGVCRGGQFIHVMNGGNLFQHVEGHLGNHQMNTVHGRSMEVTSTHHQMIHLQDEGKLVGWGEEDKGTEVVYYPTTNSLAVQYHPEYLRFNSPAVQYFGDLIDWYGN